jgi:hypothetical protein
MAGQQTPVASDQVGGIPAAETSSTRENQSSPQVIRYCDLVMKGGITSGVVYPLAIATLAKKYWFKNIGGTSAGAIAAVITSAAEYGRRNGNAKAYDIMASLPQRLGMNDLLLNLFQPATATTRIFRVALSALRSHSTPGRIARAITAMFREFWGLSLVGLALGVVVPAVLQRIYRGPLLPYVILGLLWVLVVGGGFVVMMALRDALHATATNGFGFCSGFEPSHPSGPPLTNWLHEQIQSAAGKDLSRPLTFGDLHEAPAVAGEPAMTGPRIKLQVVTTDLTLGRPFVIPFEWHSFYFDEDEFRGLFPKEVVDHLVQNSVQQPNETVLRRDNKKPLKRLPGREQLPVLVAARLSLSFPVLLSAIPLYYPDFAQAIEAKSAPRGKPRTLEADRHWFSDGGICSNFPIEFFDSPLPRWPTFGFDLEPDTSATPKTNKEMVWFSQRVAEAAPLPSNRFDRGSSFDRLAGFFSAIIDTMQNWRDKLQASAAGYHDRIVHIKLKPTEGGLNLNMPTQVINDLSERGRIAGEMLSAEFDFAAHEYARYRITMCATEKYVDNLANAWMHPVPQDVLGHEYIKGTKEPPRYKSHSPKLRKTMLESLNRLAMLSAWWRTEMKDEQSFCKDHCPHPEPVLRAQPKF